METRTYNTIVTSKELEVLNNDNKQRFYTSNGWQGSKYDIKKGAKEVAKELRSYIKSNPDLNACKWSIRSTRGMCADSLYISMMVAPFEPFTQEYKEKHEYRYNRGYSEHGTIKDYTSPEAYKLMMKVKAFVMQYIHDDSDVMTDYFDRNIYDHYEIGQYDKPFQLIEKKESTKQAEPSREPNEAKISEPIATPEGLEIVDYSEKAIAVFGDTKAIKDQLKELGGRFNPSLKYNGGKRAGWIFSKKQANKVRALLAPEPEAVEEAPAVAYEDSKISQKKEGYYTKEENGIRVESYYTEKNTSLDDLIDSGNDSAIRDMIAKKEKALNEALDNIAFYHEMGNTDFATEEQGRVDKLRRDLEKLRGSVAPFQRERPEPVEAPTNVQEASEVPNVSHGDSEISQLSDLSDLSEIARAAYRLQSQEPDKREAEVFDGFTDGNGRLKRVFKKVI